MKKISPLIIACFFATSIVSCNNQEVDYVSFFNYDGSILWKTEYYDGMVLTYEGKTPTKPSDNVYEYTFVGWNHSFEEVKEYRNFYAMYEKNMRSFTVTFKDYDGSLIDTVYIRYGGNAVEYAPDSPTRPNELRKHYSFSHWDGGDLTYVVSDMVCTAIYDVINCYEVKYYDYDGSLINTEYLEEGNDSEFDFDSYREADSSHFYVFDGWDVDVTNIQHDMVVNATYRITSACTVSFLNYDDSLLSTSKIPLGYDAEYNGKTPSKESTTSGKYRTDYIFKGWDKELKNVHSSFSTTAQFKEDCYDYIYRTALQTLISFCTIKGSEDYYVIYQGSIYSGYTGTMYEAVYATYRPWDDICYLDYFMQTVSNGVPSRTRIKIFFPKNEPGNYSVYYTYHCASFDTDGLSFFGTAKFTSSFSQYTTSIVFENYTNLGTTSLADNQQVCAGMINSALKKANNNAFFNTHDLGFINY